MKFCKIGDSWGFVFPKAMLAYAGLSAQDDLAVVAERGKLIIEKAVIDKVTIDFTAAEVDALAVGDFMSEAGRSGLMKINSRQSVKTIPR